MFQSGPKEEQSATFPLTPHGALLGFRFSICTMGTGYGSPNRVCFWFTWTLT